MKIGGKNILLGRFTYMAASNLLDFIKSGVADFRILSIYVLMLRQHDRAVVLSLFQMGFLVPVLSLESGLEDLLITL